LREAVVEPRGLSAVDVADVDTEADAESFVMDGAVVVVDEGAVVVVFIVAAVPDVVDVCGGGGPRSS
jgi:hypothetical protein